MSVKNIQFESGYIIITFDNGNVARHPIANVMRAADVPDIPASKITSGELGDARIPNLDASKINAGTLGDARIPSLNASKITAGTLGVERIPGLAASKITSGTFGSSRIADAAITHPKLASPDVAYVGVYNRSEYGRCVYGTE